MTNYKFENLHNYIADLKLGDKCEDENNVTVINKGWIETHKEYVSITQLNGSDINRIMMYGPVKMALVDAMYKQAISDIQERKDYIITV